MAGYPVPAGSHRLERVIQRSRFITTVGRARTRAEALAFVEGVRKEFPDATHHCWAFVAGRPGDSAQVGRSDAGEPRGTAGRPMLTALLHAPVGEIVAVVTRYFGGMKLGKGGLGRAYAGGVVAALESLPVERRVRRLRVEAEVAHADVPGARRVFERLDADIVDETWGAGVTYRLLVPASAIESLRAELGELSRGRSTLRELR
jgi:uncharacterized YigZ family protein